VEYGLKWYTGLYKRNTVHTIEYKNVAVIKTYRKNKQQSQINYFTGHNWNMRKRKTKNMLVTGNLQSNRRKNLKERDWND